MIQTYPCPDASRWQALLADADPADSAELEAHLSGCSRCRTVLDELAVGESGWLRDAGRLATSTAPDPEMTRTLHRLRDYWPNDAHGPPIPLDFLTPSDQPGLLGTLGRYQVLEVIGRGAMGIVLKAIDPDLLRPVAVKVLAPWLASSGTARQRFLREARAAAAVSHDHIVTIHAVEPGDLPYLVMEFVSGISLQARLDRDGPLSPRDIARIGLQAANGLAAAHEVGLVHRDVKPANILLENGVERVKITDFGLARAADDARLTQSGTAAGTPLYMSPEQARGETVDPRSDLFSLGAVLYTLATGFPPFRAGSTMGVLNRIANDPPRPIRETVPDFPAALEGIIMQLLAKDPSKRLQVAADVSVKLTAFLADPQAEPRRPRRRSPLAWGGLLPVLAGIAVLGVILMFNTPKGTLIVEVDDPTIRVAVDGEELTISGAGVGQVSLRPGTYHVTGNRLGRPATVDPPVVTITKDGKQVVKVTVRPPEPPPGGEPEVKDVNVNPILEKRLAIYFPAGPADRVDLIRLAWRDARWQRNVARKASDGPVVQTHPKYPDLQKLVMEAGKEENTADRSKELLGQGFQLAGIILKDTAESAALMGKKDPPKIDPAWDTVLRPLSDQFTALRDRLAGTKGNRFVTLPGPVTDLDKATADLAEPDRATVKRLLALRDQFALAYPKAWQVATRIDLLRDQPSAGHHIEILENELRVQHEALANALIEMDKIAVGLGAKQSTPAAFASDSDWDGKLKKLTADYAVATDELAKVSVGQVLRTTKPGDDPDKATAGWSAEGIQLGKRLMVLRDQFSLLVPQFQKDIGRWEQARLAAKDARVKFAAGRTSANELEKAELTLKDADRALAAAEAAMAKVVADMRDIRKELRPARPEDDVEAEFKKVVAEYDALCLRLVNTPIGRVLALAAGESIADSDLTAGGVPPAGQATARVLLAVRAKIKSQMFDAETQLSIIRRAGNAGDPVARQEFKFRIGAVRGLVDDLKALADKIDPPPDAEVNKLMAEYDALVLRLVKTPVGRLLTTTQPKDWKPGELTQTTLSPEQQEKAVRLLDARDQIVTQKQEFDAALKGRAESAREKAKLEASKADRKEIAGHDEWVRSHEANMKVRTEALRGLVADLKKLADEIDPSKRQ